MEFFQLPADDPRRGREGLYTSYTYGVAGRRTQVSRPRSRTRALGLRTHHGRPQRPQSI
jgi:hypothetical protein